MLLINFQTNASNPQASLVFFCPEGSELPPVTRQFDQNNQGIIKKALSHSRFKGKKGEVLALNGPLDLDHPRIVLVGLGDSAKMTIEILHQAGGALVAAMRKMPETILEVHLEDSQNDAFPIAMQAAHLALGAQLRHWRFDKYRTKEENHKKPALRSIIFVTPAAETAQTIYKCLDHVARGVCLARELVSEPANVLNPHSYADQMKDLEELGVEVEILRLADLKALKMNALIGVAQGSAFEPRVVVLQWKGGPADQAPLAFIGKGVTFDTGGISIKPSLNMGDMKYDMAGSAVVAGLIRALAGRKAAVNVVGILGIVENMPSGTAQRPGDVVVSMSGQTIEVADTDAEGRLVLADALWYTQDRFKPQFMVNLATLTGAISISLGEHYAGLFSNDDQLCDQLTQAGDKVGEQVWRFPMGDKYDQDINSDIADVRNLGPRGRAGSITAAQFLKRFVNNVPWAHLDIAGVTWSDKGSMIAEKGATAFGVRLLDQFVHDFHESTSKKYHD